MGRPLNKKYLGDPAKTGKQVVLTSAWIAGEVGPATGFYITRQVGTGRYQVSNGTVTGVVRLVAAGTLAVGEAHLEVTPFGGAPVEYARMIHNRSVKTWDSNVYKWSVEAATELGQADLDMA